MRRNVLAIAVIIASALMTSLVGLPMAMAMLWSLMPLVPDALARVLQ